MTTDSCRARQQQQGRGLETVETRELPGNDASWYRALIGDQENGQPPALDSSELGTEQQETLQLEPSQAEPSEPDAAEAVPAEPPESETPEPDPAEPPTAEVAEPATGDEEAVVVQLDQPVHFPPERSGPDADPSHDAPEIDDSVHSKTIVAVPPLPADDSSLDNTSEMVGQLWSAGESAGQLDVWSPEEMDSKVSSSRPFRWTSLLGVLAVVGLIAVGLVLLPTITQNRADDHRDMYVAVLGELRGELPDTQTSLAVATDPASTTGDFADLVTQLTVLAAKASAVDEAAQEDLPSAPPLTSSKPIDELEPIRLRIEPLGPAAIAIQRRIANLVEYRTLLDGFLDLPDLPIAADSSEQAELRVTLAAAQAESTAILAELPYDPALEDHREQVRDLNERFATWQVDYLEALRTEDSVLARALLAELGDELAELDNQLVGPLAQIRRETDVDLIALAGSIDEVVDLANAQSS
jgi:hypothetical protein